MYTDPIADLLTRLRNASRARHEFVIIPHSRLKEEVVQIFSREGFVKDVKIVRDGKFPELKVYLHDYPSISFNRKSTPGRRMYVSSSQLRPVNDGYGLGVVSTSKGLLTVVEAKEKGIGGEYICEVF